MVIKCREWGSPKSERWSKPWFPAKEDLAHLNGLHAKKIVTIDHLASGAICIAGRDYCGRIRLPSGRFVDIESKIPLNPLIEWLAFTETLPELEDWNDGPTLGPNGNLVDVLVLFYIKELAHLTQFHWRHGYTQAREVSSDFRGRLDVRRLAKTSQRLPALPCVYRERTMNTLANQVLARALDAIWRLADLNSLPAESRRKLDWMTQQWGDIDRKMPSLTQAIGQVLSRPPVGYRRTLRLARLILQGVAIDTVGGDGGDIFLVKMSAVWEEGLRRMLETWALGKGLTVGKTKDLTIKWDDATNKDDRNRWLQADALLCTENPVVFDAKYKCAYGNESREDRFQMAAYAMGFGASAAILVYPTAASGSRQRRLMKTALPGVDSEISSMELPMVLGARACAIAAHKAFDRLL